MASKVTATCCYDLLTLLLVFVDEITDIAVLIDFSNKQRTTFFKISLTILILTHISYSFALSKRLYTFGNYQLCDLWKSFITFCCLLPFGPFIALIIYLTSQQQPELNCLKQFISKIGLSIDTTIVDRRICFVLQAVIEAFPQSILQIIAIVYYQEANYISIVSALFSMFSVMSKSWIFWKETDKYTFIWFNLCLNADIFYIFFVLTWIFYSNDAINADFLGCFNFFGKIWLWKFAISAWIPLGIVGVDILRECIEEMITWFYALMTLVINAESLCWRCAWCCFLLICFVPITGTAFIIIFIIFVVIAIFVACLIEVISYSIFAGILHVISTKRIKYLNDNEVEIDKMVTEIIDFISKGESKKDRIIRILAVNYGLNECDTNRDHAAKVCEFINETMERGQYGKLEEITYADIRHNCAYPSNANLREVLFETMFSWFGYGILNWVWLLSKYIQITYPWIIVGYLLYNKLLFTNQIDTFQLIMLVINVSLQLILLLFGIYVGRIHYWLWHVEPGNTSIDWTQINNAEMMKQIHIFYDDTCWYTVVTRMLWNKVGKNIGNIIMEYI